MGIQHRAGPQICSLLASYREIAHNAENGSYSLVYCCKYNCLLGIALPQKTFLKRFYKPKKPFEKSLRAPMEDQGTKDGTVTGSKADQKKIQPRDLFWRPKFAAILASSNRPLSELCSVNTLQSSVTSQSLCGHIAVTTVTTRSLRSLRSLCSHYGHDAVR